MAVKMKCTIVSGAPETELEYMEKYFDNSYIICADSGYRKCEKLGIKPDLVIGDFDSSDKPNFDCETIALDVRKDDTDTFFCVKTAVKKGFDEIVILGGIGSRLDHTYSNILSVNYCFDHNVKCTLVNSHNMLSVISGDNVIKKNGFKYFSVFALFGKCEGLTIEDAEYNLSDTDVLPTEQYTQSNKFVSDSVKINVKKGKILLILSND